MFSGLGSITDLNNQFAQFTSNLTNLDSLQDGTSNSGTNQVAAGGKCDSQVDVTSLEKHIFELQIKLAQQESESEATNSTLLACQQDLLQEKSVTATLQIELRTVCEEKDEICAQLEAFKVKSQKEKSTLRSKLQRLEADAKGAGKLHTEEVAKEPDPEIDFLNVRLQTTASELETARSNITDLETRLAAAETSATELTQQYESQSQGSTAKMDQLEKDIQGLLSNIVELSEENGSLRTRLAVSEGHCKALEAQLEQTTASATDRDVAISSSLDEAQILKRALGEKDAQVEELQVQAGTLKDKLKDMMHRFAELKAKSGSQIQHLEERVAEVTQLMQAKVSRFHGSIL